MHKRNWSKNSKDLVKRESVTFFVDPDALQQKPKKNKRGRPYLFSHPLIQLLLVLKIQYRLSYRALEWFSKSILPLLHAAMVLPTYSLICKRSLLIGSSFVQVLFEKAKSSLD